MKRSSERSRPNYTITSALVLVLALLAAACSGTSEAVEPGPAIETNDGAVSVRPPDVLDASPTPIPQDELPPPLEGAKSTPDADFVYFDGTAGSTAEFAGRPTVMNFWASDCAACIAEMPEFDVVSQDLLGQVDVIGMNVNDQRENAVRLAEQTGVTYPLAEDVDAQIFREIGGFVMPTTVFLNAQGQVAFVWSGVLNESGLRNLIDEHIAPGSNSDV